MNKKGNTVLFMLLGTVLNIVVMFVLLILGLYLMSVITAGREIGQTGAILLFIGLFVFVFGLGFVIYNRLVTWAVKKWDLESKMDPLWTRKRKNK